MCRTLTKDRSILSQHLGDQIKKLIVDPILTTAEPTHAMIVVIDGLDECGKEVLLKELVQLLVDTTTQLPFQFLFTSRPEMHVQHTFEYSQTKSKTYPLELWNFNAHDDIRTYLRLRLSEIYETDNWLMRDVPKPWLSQKDLDSLVKQSEGLFIYVSTLVKFVADKNGLPQQKLQAVMTAHKGVDPLYDQVLSEARKFEYFE
jgi:hypothetical protein